LQGVCLDDFSERDLIKWGETLIPALVKAHQVVDSDMSADPLDVTHWALVRTFAFDQLTDIIKLLEQKLKADEVSAYGTASIFNFVSKVSHSYYDVGQQLKLLDPEEKQTTLRAADSHIREILEFSLLQ
jgi:hypothetical protein